ncbi:cytochrome c [Corallococcus sp. M34]|nr:cytochrome c [Citreicoccus inhibens]
MPQRRPPGLFVPHTHATQVVYGVLEDSAPEVASPDAKSRPHRVDDLGAVRDTRGRAPSPEALPGAERAAAVRHAREVALPGVDRGAMEGLLLEQPGQGGLPHPVGFYFAVISEGFGVMPDYAAQLPPRERWAIVAYLRALARSQRAPLAVAPPDVQGRLLQEARAP